MRHFRKACKDLSAFVCVGLILTLGSKSWVYLVRIEMLSRPNVHWSCWLRTCKITGVHLNPGVFAKYTGYLIPAQDLIVISYANTADFNTLIPTYIHVYTKLFW